ncbi:MAG: DUF1549 and DUF1553 domain-containing protein [Verrucomicrobiota bacterium]
MSKIIKLCLVLPLLLLANTQAAATAPAVALPAKLSILARAGTNDIHLTGPDAHQQIVVSLDVPKSPGAALVPSRDVTSKAKIEIIPAGIISIDASGYIKPLKNGTATLSAHFNDLSSADTIITVEKFTTPLAISFPNDVVPILTRNDCNTGGCHGKSGGQNNFRLSLLGYEPEKDYEFLVSESRGRRLFPAAPEYSLLLMKACGDTPHGGGARMDKNSDEYQLIVRWIKDGMDYAPDNDPVVERIEVLPHAKLVNPGSRQQLSVTAFFSDGSNRDITHLALYESNQPEMSEVDEHGLIKFEKQSGTTSIMVRFQEYVDIFSATIPLGAKMPQLPNPVNFIDEQIFTQLELLGMPPSPQSDDATFLRRVTVDIAGRLPTLDEAKAFISSKAPKKRASKINDLLDSPDYADHFAGKWAAILRNKRSTPGHTRGTYLFHSWIRDSLMQNKPYDQFISQIITASGEIGQNPPVAWYRAVKDQKSQMQDVAQMLLGIRIQCAQCHHHPYEKWSQDDYYSFSAFFSTLARKKGEQPGEEIIYDRRANAASTNPNTKQSLKPTPLDGETLELSPGEDPRIELSRWLTDKKNPFFSKMLVNRYWKHFFSRGLVEPEDDIRVTNPATHPKLLEQLTQSFTDSDYDMKQLIRTICNSHTYQLSAAPNEHNATDTQNYSRYYPKRLQAEVLLDSINDVAATANSFKGQIKGVRAIALPDDKFNSQSYFLTVFGRPEMDSACECERTQDANLAQSLHLINGQTLQKKLAAASGRASSLAKAKNRSDDDRITEIYLYALARSPKTEELNAAKNHLVKKRQQSAADPKKLPAEKAEQESFEDILWALINTKEFLFNH